MTTKKEILNIIKNEREAIKSKGVKKIGIFGSFVKKNENENSDIDILVSFDCPTFDNYMGLYYFLEKILKRKVDLVVEKDLKPEISYVKEEAEYVEI